MTSFVSNTKLASVAGGSDYGATSAGITFAKTFSFNFDNNDEISNNRIKQFMNMTAQMYVTTLGKLFWII